MITIPKNLSFGGIVAMLEKFKNMRILMKLFSVIIAVIVWLVVVYTVNPVITQTVKNVPVTFYGEQELAEKGLVLINKEETDEVDVRIRGARSSVIESLSLIGAYVNVSDITRVGTWNKVVSFNLGVSGVSVDGRTGETVTVQVEELVDKVVPVTVKQTGADKNKNIIVNSVPDTETITVRGAKSALAELKAIVINADITGITEDTESNLSYRLVDMSGVEREFSGLINLPDSLKVKHFVYEKRSLDVEFLLSKNRDKYALDIKSASKNKVDVGVMGEEIDIDKISKITYMLNPDDYTTPEQDYTLTADIPEGLYIPEESRIIKAKLELKELIRTDLSLNVEARNVPSSMTATLRPESVNITVRAPLGAAEKIKAYVDVGGLKPGYHELEVKTENDKGVIFEESAHIRVTIKEQKG